MIRGEARIWELNPKYFSVFEVVIYEEITSWPLRIPLERMKRLLKNDDNHDVFGDKAVAKRFGRTEKTPYWDGERWTTHPFAVFEEGIQKLLRFFRIKKTQRVRFHAPAGHLQGFVLTRIGVTPYIGAFDARTYIGFQVIDVFPLVGVAFVPHYREPYISWHFGYAIDPRFFTELKVLGMRENEISGIVFPNVPLQKHAVFSWVHTLCYKRKGYENRVALRFICEDSGVTRDTIQALIAPPFLNNKARLRLSSREEYTVILKPGYELKTESYTAPPPEGPLWYF